MKNYVLGIHFGHDANATLVKDNVCIGSVQEERFTRKKFQGGYPVNSIKYLLKNSISAYDINTIVCIGDTSPHEMGGGSVTQIYTRMLHKPPSQITCKILTSIDNIFPFLNYRKNLMIKLLKLNLKKINLQNIPIKFINHHHAHALGALYTSGFDDPLVITADGQGDGLSNSVSTIESESGKVKRHSLSKSYHSLGIVYSMVTQYLGFKPGRHEGKITGLAAYGNEVNIKFPITYDSKNNSFKTELVSSYILRSNILSFLYFIFFSPKKLLIALTTRATLSNHLITQKTLHYIEKNFSKINKEDVAYWVQSNTEKLLEKYTLNNLKIFNKKDLCVSGGLFANVKLNQKLYDIPNLNKLFVMPNMGDGGLTYGSALYVANNYKYESNKCYFNNAYLGPSYKDSEIISSLLKEKLAYKIYNDFPLIIAKYLYKGLIIGRFTGKLEWGPRALGNRSILASATNKNINSVLNERLGRTEFMPFAPIVIDEDADKIFLNYSHQMKISEYMTVTYNVRDEWHAKIPAVVHIDGTARPQIVNRKQNPSLYHILAEYKKLSGFGVLVNTSFNLHEEPIVCSPEDMINTYKGNAVDIVSIENIIVK